VKLLRAALLVTILLSTAHAQTAAPGSIQGVLVKWGTTDPVDQATIELRDALGATSIAVTASRTNGQFEFNNVVPGNYRIVALGIGYADSQYGQLRQNGSGRTIRISQGDRVRLQIGMVPGGVISGRVTDPNGRGLVYANVQLFRLAYSPEGLLSPTLVQRTITNDLGEYRLFWLPPGQYLVNSGPSTLSTVGIAIGGTNIPGNTDSTAPATAGIGGGRPRASAPPLREDGVTRFNADATVYYANARDARSADVIELRSGGEVAGINLRVSPMDAASPAVQLRGVVVDPAGAPVQGNYSLSISSWPAPTPTTLASVRPITTRVAPLNPQSVAPGAQMYANDNGKFDGAALPGTYQIRAAQGTASGRTVVDVGNRDLDVRVELRPPVSVLGRVVVEGADTASLKTILDGLLVGIRTIPASQFFGSVGADGQFKIDNVIPGDYQIFVPPLSGRTDIASLQSAYVKSIRSGGVELGGGRLTIEGKEPSPPLEIVIGMGAASIDGRVNKGDVPTNQATVVLLPDGPPPYRSDRYRTFTTDESGRFQLKGIPPGGYRLFAWEDVDAGAWFNPQFLANYERGARPLQLVEGQQVSVDLAVFPIN